MKHLLMTGAAGGLGKAALVELAARGYRIFALDIAIENLMGCSSATIIPIQCDITDAHSLLCAKEKVQGLTDRLDAIINVAGIFAMHSLSEVDPTELEHLIAVNCMGSVRVNQTFLDLLVPGQGRIINCSSEVGRFAAIPFNGPYTISKKALEAYNDTLRRELGFLGYRVIKIQGGSFRTAMHARTEEQFAHFKETTKLYGPTLKLLEPILKWELRHVHDPRHFTNALIKALEAKRPKSAYRVKNSPLLKLLTMFGQRFTDLIFLVLGRMAR